MLSDVLDRLEQVRKAPRGYLARCPAHEDRTPSLSVGVGADDRVLLHCFGGCEAVDIVAVLGLSMKDLAGDAVVGAPRVLPAVRRPVPSPTWSDQAQLDAAVDQAQDRLANAGFDHPAVQYARNRFGLTTDDVRRFRLGFMTTGGVGRLLVPLRDPRGNVLTWQARALDPTVAMRWWSPSSPSQGAWPRWGWFRGSDLAAPIVLAEGPADALTAAGLGYSSIAIRGAGNASDSATQRSVRSLAGRRQILLAGDGDAAGERFNQTFADALRSTGAWVTIAQPPAGLDLTDYRQQDPAGCAAWLQGLRS